MSHSIYDDPRWVEFADLWRPIQADLDEDLEAVETIILCSQHQKRIAGECPVYASWLQLINCRTQMVSNLHICVDLSPLILARCFAYIKA
jgi:hypothetical protein